MAYDPEVANSSGYFKDPVTKEDLSVDTPRVVKCELNGGKFIWPMVMISDGSGPIKIVYKYFTDEEKELYKAYRGRPSSGTSVRKPVEKRVSEHVKEEQEVVEPKVKASTYDDNKSARSYSTEQIINSADRCIGTSFMDGIAYAVLTVKGSNKQWHIPRSLIKADEFERLCSNDS